MLGQNEEYAQAVQLFLEHRARKQEESDSNHPCSLQEFVHVDTIQCRHRQMTAL